jgi:hypothetical protein
MGETCGVLLLKTSVRTVNNMCLSVVREDSLTFSRCCSMCCSIDCTVFSTGYTDSFCTHPTSPASIPAADVCEKKMHTLGVDEGADVIELLFERVVHLDLLFYLLARVDYRRVVAAAQFFAYRGV